MPNPISFKSGEKVALEKIPTRINQSKIDKAEAKRVTADNAVEIAEMARRLYAENTRSILLVLQGMDTAGKDGTIRAVLRGVNPRSCQIVSFKQPSEEELDHDFLWRVHQHAPRKGNIGVFNRSHYEDVLIVRVHQLVGKKIWMQRYELINEFEKLLTASGTVVVKCFLHISKKEQQQRLQERVDDPNRHWKFNPADLAERKLWRKYQSAYEDALNRCNTDDAPWHIIPSDQKWYRNLVVSDLLKRTLEKLNPKYPKPRDDFSGIVVQ